jgi:hypothetical protein
MNNILMKKHYKPILALPLLVATISIIAYLSYQKIKEPQNTAESESIKVSAVSDEVMAGIKEKEKKLRQTHAYSELLENYEKRWNLEFTYPDFWFNKARLYAGELNFEKSSYCLNKFASFNSQSIEIEDYKKVLYHVTLALEIAKKRPLSHKEIIEFTINMDVETQDQIFWNINQDPRTSLEEKLKLLKNDISIFNKYIPPNDIHCEYLIKDNYVTIDLSNNPQMKFVGPLMGLPINELNLSNTKVNISRINDYLKSTLSVFNISDNPLAFINGFISNANYRKLIARNTLYSARDLAQAKNLKYLDIEGSKFENSKDATPSNSIEYLNIAYSDFDNFECLLNFSELKVLILDQSMQVLPELIAQLTNNGVNVTIKERKTEIISTNKSVIDTIEKEKILRQKFAYNEILKEYTKLEDAGIGINDPLFWFNKAKLHAGELQFDKVSYCLSKFDTFNSHLSGSIGYYRILNFSQWAEKISTKRPLTQEEIIEFTLNMDLTVQDHILWNMNQDPNKSIEEKLRLLYKNICLFNGKLSPDYIHFDYSLKDNYIRIDLSNNSKLVYDEPLIGLPMDELDLSNTKVNIGSISSYLKTKLSVLNISGYQFSFIQENLTDCNYWKLIASNCTNFAAFRLSDAPKLKYLDIEGSKVDTRNIIPSNSLEYLNIAFTDFSIFDALPGFTHLRTLLIDGSMKIPPEIISQLGKQGVEIITK